MPPEYMSRRLPESAWPGRSDRSIPRRHAAETLDLRDNQVNVQLGPFVVMPFLGIILIFRPEVLELSLAAIAAAVAALRRSHVRYRRVRAA